MIDYKKIRKTRATGIDTKIVDLPEKTDAVNEFDYMALDDANLSKSQKFSLNTLGTQIGEANKIIDSDTIVVEEEIVSGLGTVVKLKTTAVTPEISKLSFEKVGSIDMYNNSKALLFNVKEDINGDEILYLSNGTTTAAQRLSIAKNLTTGSIAKILTTGFGANTSNTNAQVILGSRPTTDSDKASDVKWDGSNTQVKFIKGDQDYNSTPSICTITPVSGWTNLQDVQEISFSSQFAQWIIKVTQANGVGFALRVTNAQLISGSVSLPTASQDTTVISQNTNAEIYTKSGAAATDIDYSSLDLEYPHGYINNTAYYASFEPTLIRKVRPSSMQLSSDGTKIIKYPFVSLKVQGIAYMDMSFFYGKNQSDYKKLILEGYPSVIPPISESNETSLVSSDKLSYPDEHAGKIYMGIAQGTVTDVGFAYQWDIYRLHLS